MKKGIKSLILLIMIIVPVFINAETVDFNNAINEVNSYILRDNFDKRNNYILFNNPPYIMNDNGELKTDSSFNNGGMLNKKEYDYTLKSGNSWLVIPTKFWLATKTTINDKYYYLSSNGLQADEPSEKHDVRVTEFVRPGTQVSGEGTISNPWKFEDVNYATFISSDINKGYFYKGTEVDNNNSGDRKISTEVIVNNKVATVEINVKKGYVNDTSDGCGLVKVGEIEYTNTNKIKYIVSNINGNYNCTVKFIKETYTISYTLNGGKVSTPNPTTYDVDTPTITLNNPSKEYYTFNGWTGTGLSSASKSVVIPKGSTGKRDYVAKYTPIDFSISYAISNGTNNSSNKTSYNIETDTFSLSAPTPNSGYTFTGWTGTGITTKSKTVSINKGSTGDRSYTGVMCRSCSPGSHATCTLNESDCSYTTGCDSTSYKIKSGANTYNPVCEPNAQFAFKYTGKFSYKDGSGSVVEKPANPDGTEINIQSSTWWVKFLTSGTLTVNTLSSNVDLFLVGGGGAGNHPNSREGSGAGGGGYTSTQLNKSMKNASYSVTIGEGGSTKGASGEQTRIYGNFSGSNQTYSADGGGGGSATKKSGKFAGGAGTGKGGYGITAIVSMIGPNEYWGYDPNKTRPEKGGEGVKAFGNDTIDSTIYGSGGGGGYFVMASFPCEVDFPHSCGGQRPVSGGTNAGRGAMGESYGGVQGWAYREQFYATAGNGVTNTGGGGGGGSHKNDGGSTFGKGGSGIIIMRNKR